MEDKTNRFYVLKDGKQEGHAATRDAAMHFIRQLQKAEPHPFLCGKYSIIEGREEAIPYSIRDKQAMRKSEMER